MCTDFGSRSQEKILLALGHFSGDPFCPGMSIHEWGSRELRARKCSSSRLAHKPCIHRDKMAHLRASSPESTLGRSRAFFEKIPCMEMANLGAGVASERLSEENWRQKWTEPCTFSRLRAAIYSGISENGLFFG